MSELKTEHIREVDLPGWEDDKPFHVRLRRPSLLALAASGEIPNELLGAARELFSAGDSASLPLDKLGRLLLTVASAALVSPTLGELEAQGVTLTDEQLAAVYSYSQGGVRALAPFRAKQQNGEPAGNEQEVRRKTE